MASENPTAPDGFDPVEPTGTDDDQIPEKELDPGEEFVARVVDILEGEGDYGPWYRLRCIDDDGEMFDYFAEDGVKQAITQERLTEGSRVWVGKNEVAEEYDIDGQTGEYYPVQCAIGGN